MNVDHDGQHQDLSFTSAFLEGKLTEEQLGTLDAKQLEKYDFIYYIAIYYRSSNTCLILVTTYNYNITKNIKVKNSINTTLSLLNT
jgi:hypothetical protein